MIEYKDPGRYIPVIFLLYSWGSLFGVPSKVHLSVLSIAFVERTSRTHKGKKGLQNHPQKLFNKHYMSQYNPYISPITPLKRTQKSPKP